MDDRPGRRPDATAPAGADGRVAVDTAHGRVTLDRDDAAAERGARTLAAATTPAPATAVLRVERRGGRSRGPTARALERRLRAAEGVVSADAEFRAGTVRIAYDDAVTSPDALAAAVRDAGVTVRRVGTGERADGDDDEEAAVDPARRARIRREAAFVALTLAGMVGGLLAGALGAPPAVGWVAYGAAYVFGGWYGLRGAAETLRHGAVDIDLLMILAALGALTIGAPFEGAMLLFLFSLSNVLQDYAVGRSRRAIRALMTMRPETAQVLRDGAETTVPVDEVAVDDVFVVRPGDRVPLDGVVETGESSVDQSSLTGESVPVTKAPGDEVFGGTIVENGSLEVRVTRVAGESAIDRLIRMVEEAQSERAPTQRLIDRFEQPYVLAVLGITVVAAVVPWALGAAFDPTFYRAMTLMVAASPCAVVISTPAAVLSAIAAAARRGVLFKGGDGVEVAADVDAVAFDKTGTLTEGDTRLTDVAVGPDAPDDVDQDRLLALVAAVQSRSEHHLATATVDAASERGLAVPDATAFRAVVGKGVRARVDGGVVHVGNTRYFETLEDEAPPTGVERGRDALADLQDAGKTSVLVTRADDDGHRVLGWLAFTDTVRPGAADVVARLRALGVEHVVMLTGDTEAVATQIAAEVGIDEVYAELLPAQKVAAVEDLVARHDAVAMVGDGVNDAPALATASLGVAMGGAGTDVALETADLVLMGDDLSRLPYALDLGRRTHRTLLVNFGVAFAAIAVMVTTILTAGIPLPLAVVGHEGSTVLVSLNGLRLLAFDGA